MKKFSKKQVLLSSLLALGVSASLGMKKVYSLETPAAVVTEKSNKLTENLTPEQLAIVHKYAPVIFHETKNKSNPESWDFVTSFDFDGDMRGNNNEASLKSNKHDLPATVYYSLVESETHYFIVYSLFHPLDWDTVPAFIPFTWHENDMENVQVVVRKQTAELPEMPVLLSAQAHLDTEVSTISNSGISQTGQKKFAKNNFRLFSKDLNEGTHPGLYVEPGGHGIYSMTSKQERFATFDKPQLKEGFTFVPADVENNTPDIYEPGKNKFTYQLKSIYENFWGNYVSSTNIGNGGLMDGYFSYKDDLVDFKNLPRHFDSTRISGPGKADSGILPFAFSYSLRDRDLGAIFFNPAMKYASTLNVEGEWSTNYVYHPYIDSSVEIARK